MRTVKVHWGRGGWWARMDKPGWFQERGPYPFYWMASLAFPIQRWTWCLAIAIFGVALLFGHHSHARSIFPSVHELQVALNLVPGQPLPKLVVIDGAVFQPIYKRAEDRGGGEYSVVVKLERNGGK